MSGLEPESFGFGTRIEKVFQDDQEGQLGLRWDNSVPEYLKGLRPRNAVHPRHPSLRQHHQPFGEGGGKLWIPRSWAGSGWVRGRRPHRLFCTTDCSLIPPPVHFCRIRHVCEGTTQGVGVTGTMRFAANLGILVISTGRCWHEALRFYRQRVSVPIPIAVLRFPASPHSVPRLRSLTLAHVVDHWRREQSVDGTRQHGVALGTSLVRPALGSVRRPWRGQ